MATKTIVNWGDSGPLARTDISQDAIGKAAYARVQGWTEHAKLHQLDGKSDTVYQFIQWLADEKNIKLCRRVLDFVDDEDGYWESGVPLEALLAEYFKIDLLRLSTEKSEMIEKIRQQSMAFYENEDNQTRPNITTQPKQRGRKREVVKPITIERITDQPRRCDRCEQIVEAGSFIEWIRFHTVYFCDACRQELTDALNGG